MGHGQNDAADVPAAAHSAGDQCSARSEPQSRAMAAPTLLRLAYKRPREFGSRAALRGRLTLSGQPITLALRTALARLLAEL